MAILVLGGAGYIGSNAVDQLIAKGYDVITIDNLSTGFKEAIHPQATFYQGDIRDKAFLRNLFLHESIDSVMHFAASSLGRESVEQPLRYFNNNVYGTQIVLEIMQEFMVKHIVFSSSATVYGNTDQSVVSETVQTKPINPYGSSKVMMETMMGWAGKASGMTFVALRYFNVAGAKKDGTLGEVRPRLIPIVLQVAQGKHERMTIFGDDYQTPDGTCIRDYIHVSDLVDAHILALDYLKEGGESQVLNLGSAKGYSSLEVVAAARKITGQAIPVDIISSVTGDAARLVASTEKIHDLLGWEAKHSEIEEILTDAWNFQKNYPDGYTY